MSTAAAQQSNPSDSERLSREAERFAADAIGQLMEFWGFRRQVGRCWTVLYLSPQAMNTAELARSLQISTSAVNLSLGELQRWGAVRKTWQPGERKDFYEAETSVWKLLRRVYERRELNLVRDAREAFARAELCLDEARAQASHDERRRVDYMTKRIARLSALSRVGERLVRLLVAGRMINPVELLSAEERSR